MINDSAPIILVPSVESSDVHYATCSRCHARWAGPFGTREQAHDVADAANADPWYELPEPTRTVAGPCCEAPPEQTTHLPAYGSDLAGLYDAAKAAAKWTIVALLALGVVVRGAVLGALWFVRWVAGGGWLAVLAVAALSAILHASGAPQAPPDAVAWVMLSPLFVAVAYMAYRILRHLDHSRPAAPGTMVLGKSQAPSWWAQDRSSHDEHGVGPQVGTSHRSPGRDVA